MHAGFFFVKLENQLISRNALWPTSQQLLVVLVQLVILVPRVILFQCATSTYTITDTKSVVLKTNDYVILLVSFLLDSILLPASPQHHIRKTPVRNLEARQLLVLGGQVAG